MTQDTFARIAFFSGHRDYLFNFQPCFEFKEKS
jgi:hypothetical protein